ncbi:hypothetical protein L1049_026192 [Liquidambar formosana]|uniref:BRISC and BRCA1-A complex member 2 n=1 Tax=Liquidambar formosana TaxID=63359 RepID=A0AAP0NCS3_LIQFO
MAADTVPPFIAAQLNHLLTHSLLKVDQMWSGGKNHNLLDLFTLLIPFCLDFFSWYVIYNAQYPLAAPDIIFGPNDENFHLFHIAGEGEGDAKSPNNSLSEWNNKDPLRLLSLIHELREHYMSYWRKRVGEVDDAKLKFEFSTIIVVLTFIIVLQGIKMCMSSGVEKLEEVKFAVPIMDLDINKMVLGCPWRHQQKIYLQVIFLVGRKYLSAPSALRLKLASSSELKALFSIEDVNLPQWFDGMCMAGYLPNLEATLEEQALAPLFGRPVEADPIFCRKATFLAASGVFTFLVHFFLLTQFPKQQPALMLQSSQVNHENEAWKSGVLDPTVQPREAHMTIPTP